MIRSRPGQQDANPICKWHKGGKAYIANQIQHHIDAGPLLSRDEFGQDLFEAIATQAEIRQCYRNAKLERSKNRPVKAEVCEGQAVELQHHLEAILRKDTIAPADLRRILAIT